MSISSPEVTPAPPQGLVQEWYRKALAFWRRLGLTTQFLILVTALVLALSYVSGLAQRSIASRAMIETSLDLEQAMARALLSQVIGDVPLRGSIDPALKEALQATIAERLNRQYIDKVKLWGVDGRLLFDSLDPIEGAHLHDIAVQRALEGETVVVEVDPLSYENGRDAALGSVVYEVYAPIYNSDGQLVAVGEIYCSVELLVRRLNRMMAEIDQIRVLVGVVGVLLMAQLVYLAQRRLARQEEMLVATLKAKADLADRNARLLEESEGLRRNAAESTEILLNHIGAELHDGPIQLMSIAMLYQAKANPDRGADANEGKCSTLLNRALGELRNISSGLTLPELEGMSLQDCVAKAIDSFIIETGLPVQRSIDRTAVRTTGPKSIVAYRIVYEALNNGRKHAEGKDLRVGLHVFPDRAEICISDRGPGLGAPKEPGTGGARLGLLYMHHRARSVGAALSFDSRALEGGTVVKLTLPLVDVPTA